MIKLFSLKQEKAEADKAAGSGSAEKKIAPGLIRMQKGAHPCLQPPDTWRALSQPQALAQRASVDSAHGQPGSRRECLGARCKFPPRPACRAACVPQTQGPGSCLDGRPLCRQPFAVPPPARVRHRLARGTWRQEWPVRLSEPAQRGRARPRTAST